MLALRPFDPSAVASRVSETGLEPVDSSLVVVEWVAEVSLTSPPILIAPIHVHWDDDETWYVLEGELSVLLDDTVVSVPAGGAVTAVHGTRHTYWNAGERPCRYLLAMPPRVHALIAALHQEGAEDTGEIFRQFRSELLGWNLPEGTTNFSFNPS